MKKVKSIIYILLFSILLFIPCYTYAIDEETEVVETSIVLNKTALSLEVGDTATITPTVTPDGATVTWSTNDESIATVVNGVVTGRGVGSAIITATIDDKSTTCNVTVTAKQIVIGKGTDATLKSIAIKNGTFDKTFSPDVLEYSISVEQAVKSLTFSPVPVTNDSNANYQIAGNDNLKNGSVVKVIVTAEDGKTIKTYKFNIVKEVIIGLKSLKINGYSLNETFNTDTLEYTANIPYEVQIVNIQAAGIDNDSTVTVTGNTNLVVGENIVTITVKGKDDTKKVYKIKVTRESVSKVEENPTSIITSSLDNNADDGVIHLDTKNNNSTGIGDDFLKYAIVSLACLMLFTIGGIGVYFYIKTSPKKLRKELAKIKEEKSTESAIIEVEKPVVNNFEQVMNENLIDTREYRPESKTENLFGDGEDV